jgi:GTP diphosphokinase / guanosine-3',5'-bis(diphosphate) 3'-diphosphatase
VIQTPGRSSPGAVGWVRMATYDEQMKPAALAVETSRAELRAAVAARSAHDRELIERALAAAGEAHEGQVRLSGEPFIAHPVAVALILAGLGLDAETLSAALLHDVVEDTGFTLEEIERSFGPGIAAIVDGATKLSGLDFPSREEAEAENYRKMVVAMAADVRVILVKLADRLHNLRTIEFQSKRNQIQAARETLEVYAPLAHRLGIDILKSELEDLAFQTLHPRKYEEIKKMVTAQHAEREKHMRESASVLTKELEKVEIPAEISVRAKHFYWIYDNMVKKGREFNELDDLHAMRVIVERDEEEGTRDCYKMLGLIHSLWKPVPGHFGDYIAMPKFNGYRSLHTTVIGPRSRPLEIQVRTRAMDEVAELGVAAYWAYARNGRAPKRADDEWSAWARQVMDIHADEADAREFVKTFRADLTEEQVLVFTPKGDVKSLPVGATPVDFAYAVHTDIGHRTVGAKVNGSIVPLHYRLRTGDRVEILTGKVARGPSREWLSVVASSRARNKIRQFFSREQKEDWEAKGRESLRAALEGRSLPYKLAGSGLVASVIRESGFKRAEDLYLALGSGKLTATRIVDKVVRQLNVEGVDAEGLSHRRRVRVPGAVGRDTCGIKVIGAESVLVRLARCCTPVPGDEIVGYTSPHKGITIHREDCRNVRALRRNPERFTPVEWDGGGSRSLHVQIAVDSWDRPRLLEDVARTFTEHGANIVSYGGSVEDQMARNWYIAEVHDVKTLRTLLVALRSVDSVFDAYRVTPS